MRSDRRPGSFSVNTRTGRWADFATGDRGGDVVSLAAYLHGLRPGRGGAQAGRHARARAMNAYAQDDPFAPLGAGDDPPRKSGLMQPDDWQPLPVPDDAPEAPTHHPKLGAWSHRWSYRNADGSLSGYVCRFDTPAGKEMRPLRWGRRRGRVGWHWKGWAGDDARPLYGLAELTAAPDAPVLLCEGEKSADAAAGLIGPPWAAVASMNGAKSPQRTDWTPLAGRDLVIWPDNDEPGAAYAREAALLALKAGASSVRIVELPDGLPDGLGSGRPRARRHGARLSRSLIAQAPQVRPGRRGTRHLPGAVAQGRQAHAGHSLPRQGHGPGPGNRRVDARLALVRLAPGCAGLHARRRQPRVGSLPRRLRWRRQGAPHRRCR